MDLEQLKSFLGKDWEAVQRHIHNALKSDIGLLNSTNESILSHSGKQLRPILSLLVAKACTGGSLTGDSCRFAAAAELLHNATLLHDDVADESDQRRGVPTINSIMGPSVSVLVGDYWLVAAMEKILEAENGTRVIRVFSRTLSDLAEGEMLQLQKAQTGGTTEEDYLRIIFCKTASLFEAAALSAAISVNAAPDVEKAVCKYSSSLGLAFQIRDDIFDYSVGMTIGKPTGVDILEQKITLPLLGALAAAPPEESERMRKLVSGVASHPQLKDDIVSFVHGYNGIGYATERLNAFVDEAVSALDILPPSQAKDFLVELAYYVAKRQV